MKIIQEWAALFIVIAVSVLSAVAIMGIWEFFSKDVIEKSFQTLGMLALVAIIIMIAGRLIENRSSIDNSGVVDVPNPMWKSVRVVTLTTLIVSVSLLAFTGVLAIWEVIKDKDMISKSLSSLGVLSFGAFIIVMVCLEREGKLNNSHFHLSIGSATSIFVLIIFAYIFLSFFF
jgi:hypothetical protein